MEIIIIRHAEPDYNNNTLTEKGFREAEYLGKYFKDKKIDKMYVSPFPRARYTADAIIKNKENLTYEVCDFLREVTETIENEDGNRHIIMDLRLSLIGKDDNIYHKDKWREVELYGREKSLLAHYDYVKNCFYKILEENGYKFNGKFFDVTNANKDVLVFVCHFGLESYLLSTLINVSPMTLVQFTCARPSSITRVVSEERAKGEALFRMIEFGATEHLYVAGEKPSFMARMAEVYGDGDQNVD